MYLSWTSQEEAIKMKEACGGIVSGEINKKVNSTPANTHSLEQQSRLI